MQQPDHMKNTHYDEGNHKPCCLHSSQHQQLRRSDSILVLYYIHDTSDVIDNMALLMQESCMLTAVALTAERCH